MICFSDVSFSYHGSEKSILKNINLTVNDGECVLLSGKSGCGKSTLLMLINGVIPEYFEGALKGDIFVNGQEVRNNTVQKIAETIGSVFQNPKSQFFQLNTTDEVLFSCSNQGVTKEKMREKTCRNNSVVRNRKTAESKRVQTFGRRKAKTGLCKCICRNAGCFCV